MPHTIFRNGFFAFLAMILVAVATALILNAPPESSRAATQPAAAEDPDYAPVDSDQKVVDAHIEYNTPAGQS